MKAVLRHALARLLLRRGRALLAAGGIAAAGAMLGASVTVGYSLATGFDRAAERAELPHAIARFDPRPLTDVDARARGLANVRAISYRLELRVDALDANGGHDGGVTLVGAIGRPRGYAIVAGRDVDGPDEVVLERGLASEWGVEPGMEAVVGNYGGRRRLEVVGLAVSPETVAFPLVQSPRVYALYETVLRLTRAPRGTVNVAQLWVSDERLLDVTLAQARTQSYGVGGLEFVTRSGIRVLVGQAAGIVIALLVAFSVVALGAAGVMLAASAAAEVQRRLEAIGLLRALGASPRDVATGYAAEAVLVALPSGALGVVAGWAVVAGPTGDLLTALNQLAPGTGLAALLAASLAALVAVVALASALPAWRAARRSPVETLRAGDVVAPPRRTAGAGGAAGLGVRLALARPLRTGLLVSVLAASAAVVLLILTIASLLRSLAEDPHAVGKRYSLTVAAGPRAAARIARLPGVDRAAPRYETYAADSFGLGESFRLIAFPGDHTAYEAPALAEGRRVRADGEIEVGLGLAHALNLHPGATLAAQLPSGTELRYRVVGVVRALEQEGRIAYVRPGRLLRAEPSLAPRIAVVIAAGARAADVRRELARNGFFPESSGGVAGEAVQGWAVRNSGFLDILVALLRGVAAIEGLVCLYALAQMLALTAQERQRAVAVVRALGASRRQVLQVFAGAALLVAVLAAPLGLLLERAVVAPAVGRIAASYVALPLAAGATEALVVALGLAAGALGAAAPG